MDRKGFSLMMFREAEDRTAAHTASLEDQLAASLEYLDKTASTWFDNTVDSVQKRQSVLTRTAKLCRTYASVAGNDEDSAEIAEFGRAFEAQARALEDESTFANDDAMSIEAGYAPNPTQAFRQAAFMSTEASGTGNTDWDLFLSIEPRIFVADNASAARDSREMRERAFDFMAERVAGQRLTRQAKMDVTADFLDAVEDERQRATRKTAKRGKRVAAVKDELPDVLFGV